MTSMKGVRDELWVSDNMLFRCAELPIYSKVHVLVIPFILHEDVVSAAHANSGHASWQTVYEMLRP